MSGDQGMDEMLGNIRQQNGSAAVGQEHSSPSSSSSSELIHNQQEGDQPLLIPRSEVGNSCVNNSSSLEDEEAAAAATEQPQMDLAAVQAQQLCNQGGHNMMSLNLNQDLNYNNLGDQQEIISSDAFPASQTQTLFGFDLSLTRSAMAANTTNNRAGGGEAHHIYHAAQQQPRQLIQPPTHFIGVPNNNNYVAAFGNNNGVVFSQFNGTPSRAQVFRQAAPMLPTHDFYAPPGDEAPPSQFLHPQLLPPHHHQMQVTWPETMASQQSEWSPAHQYHLHYGLQHPTHRPPPTLASRRQYLTNLLYDPHFEYSGLPVDPLLRMFVCNPNFANRNWN